MAKVEWKAKKVKLASAIIGASITLVIGVVLGLSWNNYAPYLGGRITGDSKISWSELNEVYNALAANYDGEIDKAAVIDGAKHGLVDAIGDKYTEYMNKDETTEFNGYLHGDVGAGIGVEMGLRDGYVRVLRLLPDNPAKKAGVLAGDIIYKVDDKEVYTWSTEDIANVLRGAAGTTVKLTIVRDGEEKSFELTRETINNVSAYVDYKKHNTAVITVTRFDNDTGALVQSFANEILNKGTQKIILDLRSNGGGYVSAARDLLSLWLDGEKVLIQKSKLSAVDDITYSNRGRALFANIKTVILVNNNTASASEIVAGALKDYGKATIVGETTYGKGVVQNMLNLSGGTTLKVTSAHWYTPNGNTINQTGIEPDHKVVNTYDDVNHSRDPQMDKALEI
ncbi:S41 family peptidase [Candidatus Saccharibacteria bacterium]|nr:S41 family peptidase [Candidatus Saccharibacteria bacterium]MBR6123118.1 S41 family peptidase [Candidatus Saccharibacteria bacterium]